MTTENKFYQVVSDYKRKPWKGVRPVVTQDVPNRATYGYYRDKDIRNLIRHTIRDLPENREWCYFNESMCPSLTTLISNSLTGPGLRVSTKNKDALECITEFNKKVNFRGQCIEDVIGDQLADNFMHSFAAWRVLLSDEADFGVVIDRMSPRTLIPVENKVTGYLKFVQIAEYDDSVPTNKSKFDKNYRPVLDLDNLKAYQPTSKYYEIHIPVDSTLHLKLFKRPPITTAMPYIVQKRWTLWFMKKSGEKFWSPTIWAKVGLPEYYPEDPEEYEKVLKAVDAKLQDWHIFKSIATPFDTDIKVIESQRKQMDFPNEIDMLDKQIALCLFVSSGMINPSGSELAISRQLDENYQRFLQGLRRKVSISYERFYKTILLPANGIEPPKDLMLDYSHLKQGSDTEYIDVVVKAFEHGIFKDYAELVKAVKPIWSWLDEDRTDETPKYLKNWFEAQKTKDAFGMSNLAGKNTDKGDPNRLKNRPTEKTESKKNA